MTRPRRFLASTRACFLAAAAFYLSVCLLPAQEVLDGIAALVNDQPITFSQVREVVGPQEQSIHDTTTGKQQVEKIKELRLSALNKLIDRELILQEFKAMQKKGAQIPPHVVDEHIEAIIRDRFGNDRQAFLRTLAAQGMTYDRFRQQQEEEIIVQAMRSQQIKGSVIIPEPKIVQEYNKTIELYTSEEQVKLRMIVLRKSPGESDARRKMMEEIREKIQAGAPFEDLARMYSDTNQEQGGDWGWISRRTLNEQLTKIAFGLKAGQMSPIVEVENNYYLMYCEAKKPTVRRPLKEVHDEIEKRLVQEQRQQQMQEWTSKLRKKAFIKIY